MHPGSCIADMVWSYSGGLSGQSVQENFISLNQAIESKILRAVLTRSGGFLASLAGSFVACRALLREFMKLSDMTHLLI